MVRPRINRVKRTRIMEPAYAGSMVVYAALRVLLLIVAGAGLYFAGLRGWLLAVVSILVAAMLSYIFLPQRRDRAANKLASVAQRSRDAASEGRTNDEEAEDAQIAAGASDESDVDGHEDGAEDGHEPGHVEDVGADTGRAEGV